MSSKMPIRCQHNWKSGAGFCLHRTCDNFTQVNTGSIFHPFCANICARRVSYCSSQLPISVFSNNAMQPAESTCMHTWVNGCPWPQPAWG